MIHYLMIEICKIKPELARQGLHCCLGFDPTRECPDKEYF